MVQIRTDMGTYGSEGDLGSPAQAAAMTAEDTTALTADSAQTETASTAQTETAALADAPAGGGGATAGAYDSAANRDTMIACVNRNKVRIGEHRLILDGEVVRVAEHRLILDASVVRVGEITALQIKILARVKELEDALENVGLFAKN